MTWNSVKGLAHTNNLENSTLELLVMGAVPQHDTPTTPITEMIP